MKSLQNVSRAGWSTRFSRLAPACSSIPPREDASISRRAAFTGLVLTPVLLSSPLAVQAELSKYEPMDALKAKDYGKTRMKYSDYIETPSGLQYQDIREGTGDSPQKGQQVVVDWSGYTIGYYGRPFESRNKPKGSSFGDKDFIRFRLGEGKYIPGFEEALYGMKPGGIRRVIVPVELGYPEEDWTKKGPKPATFAGERALDFVLKNRGMIDKTLLFNIELIRVDD